MLHAPHTKFHVVSTVLESGYDGNLAKGQLAVVKNKALRGKGKEVTNNFDAMTAKDLIALEIGEATTPNKQRTVEVPYVSTGFFPIGSITDIKAYAPSNVTLKLDHIEIGYDGINADTALYIPEGKAAVMDIVVEGLVASMFFGKEHFIIQKRVYRAEGESMQSVVRRLVKELNEEVIPTATGWASTTDVLSQFLEIGTIDSTAIDANGVDYKFSTLTVTDNGDSNDLADVRAQYPDYKVELTSRDGDLSTYTIVAPSNVSLSDYVKTVVDVDGKGCANCLSGYSLVEGGYVYHVALEDDGADLTTTVEGYFTGEIDVIKFGNKDGKGTYSVLLPNVITDTDRDAVLAGHSEAEILYVGEVKDVCSKESTVSTKWVAGNTCTATDKTFKITLKDNECGESRLTELQEAYPDLTIIEGVYTGVASQAVTLTGSSGNAVLKINGVNYTQAYNTSLTQTATDFVTNHATNINTATGATVTSSGAVITITAPSFNFPTVAGVAGGLTETVANVVYATSAETGGCKRTYSTKTVTNLVCDQCDDIFMQPFYAEAPTPYEGISWVANEEVYDEDAKMGIFIKGKPFYMYPEIYEEDFVPFIETSLKVKSASFGWREDDILNYTGSQYDVDLEFAKVEFIERAQDVNNLSQSFFGAEDEGKMFGTNKWKHKANLFARTNLSEERILKYHKRLLRYVIEFKDQRLSQGAASTSNITHGFGLIVEEGKHEAIQDILNKLAAKVGLPAVTPSVI